MKKIVVLTGAGVSAESGIRTFRDSNGLWEDHEVMDVASPEGWARDPELVLRFYNARRAQLKEVEPNAAHVAIKELESQFEVRVITQNVDDLHERAGSSNVLHLHGELTKARSTRDDSLIYDWTGDINLGDLCEDGHQLRPHIVWFGESVPALDQAASITSEANIVLIVGTSLQVYPAAGLVGYAPPDADIYYIDPSPASNHETAERGDKLTVIAEPAAMALPKLARQLRNDAKG
ncbi:NAD-dependent deacylase [Mariniblastus sp.]|nr:NAD-dependent deacylase [Mariniblastus sp.]